MKINIERAAGFLSSIASAANKGPQHQAQIEMQAALEAADKRLEAIEARLTALEQSKAEAPAEATATA